MRLAAFFFASLAVAVQAAPFKRDLGRNLVLHRVQELPADLPALDQARRQPAVLDMRYVRGDQAAAAAVQAWLRSHASARTPVFVLANAETGSALVAHDDLAHVLVIGAAGRDFTPDIAVQSTPEDERRAYDALAAGADFSTLITENPTKIRNDEASLSRDRSTEPDTDPSASGAAKEAAASPPVDAALQRAVHLHRALLALKKI